MTKNRSETEKSILAAVTDIVRERGFGALGVNAVAEAAGVSKVLIYRYFGSYRGLLEDWALQRNFWFTGTADIEKALAGAAGDRAALATVLKRIVRSQADELRTDKVSREVLRWFIAEKDTAAATVMARLEERGTAIAASIARGLGADEDPAAISAVVIAGVYYLALLSDRAEVFNGVEISSDAGWERILGTLDRLVDILVLSAGR
jgi:AcrR family transcriptional regulator